MSIDRRLQLHEELCQIIGSRNVYFQTPDSLNMDYPCIRYNRKGKDTSHADDMVYRSINEYNIIVIDPDPDSEIDQQIMNHFTKCRFNRAYTAENLNHYQLTLYY